MGALATAEDRGYCWVNVAGTSAGAIVTTLAAAGYTGREMNAILQELDYHRFEDTSLLGRIPVAGPLASLLLGKGIMKAISWNNGWEICSCRRACAPSPY